MRVGIYARVSTADKEQNPETQLVPLREFCASQNGWQVIGEYIDKCSATDLRGRKAWRELLDAAAKRRIDLVLLWRIDRAFRSVPDAASTLERFRSWGVGLRSYQESWIDTTTPFGEALYYITCAYASLESGILSERVRAGMERARRQGKRLERPRTVKREWDRIRPLIENGTISQRKAAQVLGVGRSTVSRLMSQNGSVNGAPQGRI